MTLAGKRIVNTRAADQAAGLNDLLRARGAIPLDYPAIAIVPPEDSAALDQALAGEYDLLVLTSANSVEALARRAEALGFSFNGVRAAVVGRATARAAREKLGVEIALMPDEYNAEALANALTITPGMRILLPQSQIARPALAQTLIARGAQVTAITAYQTVLGQGGVELIPLLRAVQVDAVTFTSASTARCFAERLRGEGGGSLDGICAACLSRQVSRAAREEGFRITCETETNTLEGLIEALDRYFGVRL